MTGTGEFGFGGLLSSQLCHIAAPSQRRPLMTAAAVYVARRLARMRLLIVYGLDSSLEVSGEIARGMVANVPGPSSSTTTQNSLETSISFAGHRVLMLYIVRQKSVAELRFVVFHSTVVQRRAARESRCGVRIHSLGEVNAYTQRNRNLSKD